jgi:L-methionine (R)-S-oxide reductase
LIFLTADCRPLTAYPISLPKMHHVSPLNWTDKPAAYEVLAAELASLLGGERDRVANAANAAALLYHSLPDVNWTGFYFLQAGELVLGPFQGKPACERIPVGRGVCGTAAARAASILVPNVGDFPGHIACDSQSRSELVVPLFDESELVGVLDIDSPMLARFDEHDRAGCERLARILVDSWKRSAVSGQR